MLRMAGVDAEGGVAEMEPQATVTSAVAANVPSHPVLIVVSANAGRDDRL